MSISNIVDDAMFAVEDALKDLPRVRAEKIGLDGRAGYVWVDVEGECIVAKNPRSLEYYGGFEYVDDDYKTPIGEYVIYSGDDDRVSSCLEYYEYHHEK